MVVRYIVAVRVTILAIFETFFSSSIIAAGLAAAVVTASSDDTVCGCGWASAIVIAAVSVAAVFFLTAVTELAL